jgi:hypothetical protein
MNITIAFPFYPDISFKNLFPHLFLNLSPFISHHTPKKPDPTTLIHIANIRALNHPH